MKMKLNFCRQPLLTIRSSCSKHSALIPQHSVLLFALCSMLLAPWFPSEAQQVAKMQRIGLLRLTQLPKDRIDAFQEGLRAEGYTERQNFAIEHRYADGKADRLPSLAAELVQVKVEAIVALGPPALHAAKKATNSIPIVMVASVDPVAAGMVASLARPGGNMTGLSIHDLEISGKQLELLKQTVPSINRVAVLWNPKTHGTRLHELESAANSLKVELQPIQFRGPEDFSNVFDKAKKERADGLLTLPVGMTRDHWKSLADFATRERLPLLSGAAAVEAGALMYYGVSYPPLFKRAAYYVARILRGTKPGDLPIERPISFELVINLKTAKQIGVTIPPNVLVRADKVIR